MAPNYLALSVPCNLSSQSACLTLLGNLVLPIKRFATAGSSVCPAGVHGGRSDPLRQVKGRERIESGSHFAAFLSVFPQCLKSGCGPELRTPGNTWMFILSHLPSWTSHRLTSSCFGVYSTAFHPTPPFLCTPSSGLWALQLLHLPSLRGSLSWGWLRLSVLLLWLSSISPGFPLPKELFPVCL